MCSRNKEEIEALLESAKLKVSELLPISQELYFDSHFSGTEMKLLELDKEVAEALQIGDRLVIRGECNDTAVLCTSTSTFEIKDVETSNSLLILKQLTYPEDVDKLLNLTAYSKQDENETRVSPVRIDGDEIEDTNDLPIQLKNEEGKNQFVGKSCILQMAHSYLELSKVKPKLTRIQQVLEPTAYKGSSEEEQIEQLCRDRSSGVEYITLDKLLDTIPGSKTEIENYIKSNLRTVEINGNIRLVRSDYLFQALSQVLDYIEINSWTTRNINAETIIGELNGLYEEFLLRKIFEWFFDAQEEIENDPVLHAMNEYEICRLIGTVILKSGKNFTVKDFLIAWGESVPNGLRVKLTQLKGLAITDEESVPSVIWYFPEEQLPDSIPDRFAFLFETKPKWKYEEIIPYVESLTVSTQSASTLLTKHSRVHTIGGIKYYASKHAK